MSTWKEVDEARYDDMLGALPPAYHDRSGFLVGEPWSHRACKATGTRDQPTFAAFAQYAGKFYENDHAMTLAEYLAFRRAFAHDRSLLPW